MSDTCWWRFPGPTPTDALIRGTGTELFECDHGLTYLLAHDFDQLRLHMLFDLFRDLNIELVSVNELLAEPSDW